MLLVTGNVQAYSSCLASLCSPASCYFRCVCYVHCSQAQPREQLTVRAPLPQHSGVGISKPIFLGVSFLITQDSRGKEGPDSPSASLHEVIQEYCPALSAHFLPSQKHWPKPGAIRLSCNVHLCPDMTNGPSEIVSSPASETTFEMSLTCWVLSPIVAKTAVQPWQEQLARSPWIHEPPETQDRSAYSHKVTG